MPTDRQGTIIGGLVIAGVLIYAAISDSSIWQTLTGGSHGIDYTDGFADGSGAPGVGDGGGPGQEPVAGGGAGIGGLLAAADAINALDLPYVWGGGHASAGTPSGGPPAGYDCSGVTAAVLVGGGFWDKGSEVPADAGIISALRAKGIIAPGMGKGIPECTLFDNPGDHIFLRINGEIFGTSDGDDGTGNHTKFGKGGGGGTWLDAGPDVPIFQHYHILPELLDPSTNLGTGKNPRGIAIN
jgi:hypothetical protein